MGRRTVPRAARPHGGSTRTQRQPARPDADRARRAACPPRSATGWPSRIEAHLTTFGLATERPGSPHYEPDGYWRGPIWAPSTVLIEDGLRRAGHVRLADEISARFRALCETSGFAENFDALTGEGLRDRAYTWTASSYLLLARDHQRRGADAMTAATVA